MVKLFLSFLILFFVPLSLFSFQWPVTDPVLIAAFAEDAKGAFLEGIDLSGSNKTVKPISQGEMVFFHSGNGRQSDLPSPLGNLVVLQHRRGVYSFYAHLGTIKGNDRHFYFSEKDPLGTTGSSGMSQGESLFLALLDGEFKQFVNPLLSLPPLQDTIRPKIGNLFLLTPHSRQKVVKGTVVRSGTYTMAVEVRDFSNNAAFYCPLPPYSIDLYVNGERKKSITFEFLTLKKNKRVLQNTLITYSDLYKGPWLFSVGSFELSPGDTRIELSVKDFEGNEAVGLFRITGVEQTP